MFFYEAHLSQCCCVREQRVCLQDFVMSGFVLMIRGKETLIPQEGLLDPPVHLRSPACYAVLCL